MTNTAQQPGEWLTKAEAAEHLGVSPKSIQNYVAKGLLSCKREMTKTGEAVFLPRSEVEDFKAKREAVSFHPMVESVGANTNLPLVATTSNPYPIQLVEREIQGRLMDAVEVLLKRSHTPNKLMLTIDEAHDVSGLPKNYIKDVILNGKLKAVKVSRRWLVKRSELEAFIEGL